MSPKTQFDKETIVEAAFEIAKESGMSSITTRSLAKRLGSSVAPIYVNFKNVEDLIDAVVKRVMVVSEELLAKQTGSSYYNRIGKASLAFAREYPVIFRDFAMKPNEYIASYETMEKQLLDIMAKDDAMADWSINDRKELLFKMRVFQIGLSVMIANNQIPSWLNENATEDLLMDTGEELLTALNLKRSEKTTSNR